MRRAIIADVHGNLPALQAVMADIQRREVDEIVCLGDLVGYNTFPRETLSLLRRLAIPSVQGNHDLMAIGQLEPDSCGPNGRAAIAWTRTVLTNDEQAYLRALPAYVESDSTTILVHSCLGDPVSRLRRPEDFVVQREILGRLGSGLRRCYTGHTHVAQVTEIDSSGLVSMHRKSRVRLNSASFCFINPGSVGHPRESDYRASYAIHNTATDAVLFRRVAYDRPAMDAENARHGIFTILGPSVASHRMRHLLRAVRGTAARAAKLRIGG
jgi:predicted phosphodiesterase